MNKFLLIFFALLLLLACKKDALEGGYSILQGKWKWIGAREIKTLNANGSQTSSWISSSEFSDNYFIEFEKKGKLSHWTNSSETKFYRIEHVWDDPDCDFNYVKDCHYVGINLNFNPEKSMGIYMNNDTMVILSNSTNAPIQNYSDQEAGYSYMHRYVRIN